MDSPSPTRKDSESPRHGGFDTRSCSFYLRERPAESRSHGLGIIIKRSGKSFDTTSSRCISTYEKTDVTTNSHDKKSEIAVSLPSTSQNSGNVGQTRRSGLYETHAPGVMRYFSFSFPSIYVLTPTTLALRRGGPGIKQRKGFLDLSPPSAKSSKPRYPMTTFPLEFRDLIQQPTTRPLTARLACKEPSRRV